MIATDTAAPPASKKKAPPKVPKAKPPSAPAGPAYDPTTMRLAPLPPNDSFKVLSWNVAGLRALLKKDPDSLKNLVQAEQPDILCLQEHKLQDSHCNELDYQISKSLPGWHTHWACSTDKRGYSGVAILTNEGQKKKKGGEGEADASSSTATTSIIKVTTGIPGHNGEGRVLTAEFNQFYLVNVYVPNAGEGLKRLDYRLNNWDKDFASYLIELSTKKPLIITGDLNCAHKEIDIHNPKTNLKSAGFTPEERESFQTNLLNDVGLEDAFRKQHPNVVSYTYWGYRFNARASNKGWRLDYFLVSREMYEKEMVYECYHLPDLKGSDHCPLGLVLRKK